MLPVPLCYCTAHSVQDNLLLGKFRVDEALMPPGHLRYVQLDFQATPKSGCFPEFSESSMSFIPAVVGFGLKFSLRPPRHWFGESFAQGEADFSGTSWASKIPNISSNPPALEIDRFSRSLRSLTPPKILFLEHRFDSRPICLENMVFQSVQVFPMLGFWHHSYISWFRKNLFSLETRSRGMVVNAAEEWRDVVSHAAAQSVEAKRTFIWSK